MGLLDAFIKKKPVTFEGIDSLEKVKEECKKCNLERMFIMAPIFGGKEDDSNALYVPVGINKIKETYDRILVDLLKQGKAKSYNCSPEYKGRSFVPSKIIITAGKDGVVVFKETINIW